MARRLDHLVLCVDDLDRARASYAAMGFTLTPPATHPFGTRNSLVQFARENFLELVAVAEPSAIPPHTPAAFSFAAFNRDYLARNGEGLSMLAFATDDAAADVGRFRAGGLRTYDRFDFGRDAALPDGSAARVGFSLAFATHPAAPDAGFFTCQHRHAPELFWKPEYQAHANGAIGIVEVVLSAAEPAALADFLAVLTGAPVQAEPGGLRAGQGRSRVTVLDPAHLAARLPDFAPSELPPSATPRLRAFRLAVADLGIASAVLARRGVAHRAEGNRLVVPPGAAHGVAIELVEAENDGSVVT